MHTYPHPITGAPLPSVTTILEETMSEEQRARLGQYYAKPQSHRQNIESQQRGNAVDAWAKGYLMGQTIEIDWRYQPYCLRLRPTLDFLKGYYDRLTVDQFVYTDEYAGTIDIAGCSDGFWTILDIKTKTHLYAPAIEVHKLQLMGYQQGFQDCRGESVEALVVIVVTPNQCQSYRVESPQELQGLAQQWQQRVQMFQGRGQRAEGR